VRDVGYAIETGENEDGAICIGVPILDQHSRPVAALSLSAPERRKTDSLVEQASAALIKAGHTITQRIG
jgi:IclR family KDG regulon transcriptional repressor